jgi:hypothetical protein
MLLLPHKRKRPRSGAEVRFKISNIKYQKQLGRTGCIITGGGDSDKAFDIDAHLA